MQVNVNTRHGQLAEGTQQKIAQKLQKITRFHDRISAIDAMIDLADSKEPTVEVIVAVDRAPDFVVRVKTTNGNLLGAAESASGKLQEQLKRHKEKKIDSHRGPAPRDLESPVDEDEEVTTED